MKRELFEKNGKPYERVEETCPRCGGHGIFYVAVHNGNGVPAQPDGGTCYKCNGAGVVVTERRILDDKEKAQRERAKERYAEKREAKIEENKKQMIITSNINFAKTNFMDSDKVYVVDLEDTYSIKEELKEAGAKWNTAFKRWCFADVPVKYPVKLVKLSDVCIMDEDGYFVFEDNYLEIIANMLTKVEKPASEYVGTINSKVDLEVTVKRIFGFDGFYGTSFIVTMEDSNGNTIVWKTSSYKLEEGKTYTMTAGVKEHSEYKDVKQTIITRPTKIKELKPTVIENYYDDEDTCNDYVRGVFETQEDFIMWANGGKL